MRFVLSPDWFLNIDVLIEIFSFIVLFIFAFLCYKNYKLNKNKKFLYLGGGFGLIALAQLATIATKFVLYYDTGFTQNIGHIVVVTYNVVKSVDIFYNAGFFINRLFTLLGLYAIYKLPVEKERWEEFLLAVFFIGIISILSRNLTYLFHLTALVLLLLITKHYYFVYKKNESSNTLILIFAFGLLAFSNIILATTKLSSMYVVANMVGLASYITLLVLIVRILKHGKKKKPNGHNI